jgi:hypothetical protein
MSILKFLGVLGEMTDPQRGTSSAPPPRNRKLTLESLEGRAMLTVLDAIASDAADTPFVSSPLPSEEQSPADEPIAEDTSLSTDPAISEEEPADTVFDPAPADGTGSGDGGGELQSSGSGEAEGSGGGWGGESEAGYGGISESGTGSGSESGTGGGSASGSGGGEVSSGGGSGAGSGTGTGEATDPAVTSLEYMRDGDWVRFMGSAEDNESLEGMTVHFTSSLGHEFTATINADGTFATIGFTMPPGTEVIAYFIDADGNRSETVSLIV